MAWKRRRLPEAGTGVVAAALTVGVATLGSDAATVMGLGVAGGAAGCGPATGVAGEATVGGEQ